MVLRPTLAQWMVADMRIISRVEWGAQNANSPGGTKVDLSQRTEFFVHYSTGEELGRKDTANWVREIQAFHTGPQRGWSDIAYNFLVDVYGNVFEGRGWGIVGAHCPNHNTTGIGVCFLGDDDKDAQDASPAARASLKALADEADRLTGKRLKRQGHRDGKPSTQCPGDELYTWVHAGMPLDAAVRPPAPSPAPLPPKPSPGSAPAFPLPPGSYFGPRDGGPRSISGYSSHRDALKQWQDQMKKRGWTLAADGLYGSGTRTVAGKFQAQKGLPVDGLIGPKTWAAAWNSPIT